MSLLFSQPAPGQRQGKSLLIMSTGHSYSFGVMAEQMVTTDRFRQISEEQRKCKFSNEDKESKMFSKYSKSGCQFEVIRLQFDFHNRLKSFHHGTIIIIDNAHGRLYTFWLLKQCSYNQVQKLVLHRYLPHFRLGLCGLILFSYF